MLQLIVDFVFWFLDYVDFCVFSVIVLVDQGVEQVIFVVIFVSGRCFFVLYGVVLGLDGLCDGCGLIDSVMVIMMKSGKSFGLDFLISGMVYEGLVCGVCLCFLCNVNVYVVVVVVGIGLDCIVSCIVVVLY